MATRSASLVRIEKNVALVYVGARRVSASSLGVVGFADFRSADLCDSLELRLAVFPFSCALVLDREKRAG